MCNGLWTRAEDFGHEQRTLDTSREDILEIYTLIVNKQNITLYAVERILNNIV